MTASGKVLRLNTGEKMGEISLGPQRLFHLQWPPLPRGPGLTHLISKAPAPMLGSSRGTPHEKACLPPGLLFS